MWVVDSFTNCNKVSFTALTGQLIVTEVKECQLPQLPNLAGNGTCQRISRTNQRLVDSFTNCNQVSFTAPTGQLIAPELKVCQLPQLPNFGRNGTCQRISVQTSEW